jgi:DNA topoisomerase-2
MERSRVNKANMFVQKKVTYTKQDPITHILTRPDMYVGSKGFDRQQVYVYTNETIVSREVSVSPALVRTFVEILSNAIDNMERDTKMTYISVDLNATQCEIKNDGAVIPIEQNEVETSKGKKKLIYNHSLIFGHLLSGSNYDDTEKRYTSGRNGLGAKLTNVLSTSFTVEGVDPTNKTKLVQTWTNNMRDTSGPKVSRSSRVNGYTSIKWSWDCEWFGMKKGLPQDTLDLLAMHVLNASLLTGLTVTLNGTELPNKIASYFDLLSGCDTSNILKLKNDHSRVFVIPSTEFEAISFVNGIQTKNGGKHVNAWVEAVCRPVIEKLKGRKRSTSDTSLTIKDVKPYFKFLVVTRIPNPEFESQEKNELKTSVKADPITSSQVTKIMKWPIGEALKGLMLTKEKKQVTKAIAASSKHPMIDGYDRANNAGGAKGKDCTLIVCEGLSAKTFAVDGISKGLNGKKGRDWFGIYPLRGKMLNTRNATPTSIKNNAVITNLMKIIGLDYGNPNKLEKLNYGRLCIITDADVDGIHIEGLILNFFHSLFPELLKRNFVISMKTPILRVGKTYYFDERSATVAFQNKGREKVKYYKGLGAIEPKETDKVFGIKMLQFEEDKASDDSFKTAFDKAESSERKGWLSQYNPRDQNKRTLDDEDSKNEMIKFTISRHLNDELIKFFHDDCKRSIPSALDGLKESQRKIVYAAKKCNLKSGDIKVAQFGADVAKHTNYHHGEENLFKTIIKMAQSFPGSNNIPLFAELGRFGTRLEGGEDAASPRYIKTNVVPEFNNLFNPLDDALLDMREDDGDLVEPYHYVPTIPLLLVNGCVGIGTGWMCNMPQFNPKDVATACHRWMADRHEFLEFVATMKPWYNGFSGDIEKVSDTKFQTKGTYTERNGVIHVTELPVGLWNSKFQKMLDEKEVRYNNRSTPSTVDYEIFTDSKFDMKDFEKKMCTSLNLDNIVVFDKDDKIAKVTLVELFDMWGDARLTLNRKRKVCLIADVDKRTRIATCKSKFIEAVRAKKIDVTSEEKKIVDIIKYEEIAKDDADIKMLLDLPVRTLTGERRKELELSIKKMANERSIIVKKSDVDMWFEDMANLHV